MNTNKIKTKIMAYKVIDGLVYDEARTCVAVLADLPTEEREEVIKVIEFGSEAAPLLQDILEEINSGSFKPRSIAKRLEAISYKYS